MDIDSISDSCLPQLLDKATPYGVERSFPAGPAGWINPVVLSKGATFYYDDFTLLERLRFALAKLADSVDIDPQIFSGVPVLKGTRFPVSQVLAEIANNNNITEISDDWDLDLDTVRKFLRGLSIYLDRPYRS